MSRARTSRSVLTAVVVAVAATGSALLSAPAVAAAASDGSKEKTNRGATEVGVGYDRFIVHFEPGTAADSSDAAAQAELDEVGRDAGHGLRVTRRLATSGALVQVDSSLDKDKADRLLAKLVAKAGVAYAEPDVVMTATLTPLDPSYAAQWHYSEPTAGLNLPTAWDTATGAGVTVAVLDTGITAHSDLAANVVGGYDFVSSASAARDGDGRDLNPADAGDWTTAGQCGAGSTARNSSWHGTHVAGTIAAVASNGTGGTGVAFGATVVPVRVLAACGGTLADIADAIVWASGGTVAGVPSRTPAQVINMSLGGSGTCGATYQNAINGAVSRGTTVVVAAGNSNADAAGYQPSSCTDTVVVAASDREGNRASYSNFGTIIDVAAPGGETGVSTANGVLSTLNTGTTTPLAEGYAYYQGTSMATPHVAGLVALLQQGRSFSPAEVETRLKNGTRQLPGACTGGCGAGLADATATVAAIGTPLPAPAPSLFVNETDVLIADAGAAATSPITVAGRSGNASSALKVAVNITHPRRGDLQIDVQAPGGSLYRLKNPRKQDTAANLVTTYTVNASAEVANGTWTLLVRDTRAGGSGPSQLNSWSLQF